MPRHQFSVFAALFLLLQLHPAIAQTPHDYYTANATPADAELLRNVEAYHLNQGMQQLRDRRPQAAWADFDFILRHFPNHPRALMLMADLCDAWRGPRCDTAAYLEKAERISPDSAGVHLTKGVYLQKRGKIKEAIEAYRKSAELNPGSANLNYNLGLAYFADKQYALANEHAQKAYAMGMTLPALQQKLVSVKAWKPVEAKPAADAAQGPAAAAPPASESTPDAGGK